jgi:ribonucleotide reductase beta subunit family protein with ferritin-like domain
MTSVLSPHVKSAFLSATATRMQPVASSRRTRTVTQTVKSVSDASSSATVMFDELSGWSSLAEREEFKAREKLDPLLNEDTTRKSLVPIQYGDLWEHYKKQQSTPWDFEEVDLSEDKVEWEHRLNDDERECIGHVLGFFANSDVLVNDNIGRRFMDMFPHPEVQFNYQYQMKMENIHTETYGFTIEALVSDPLLRTKYLTATESIPSVKRKAVWQQQVMDNEELSVAERLIAAICVEGIFFSSSFCVINWLKKRGLMPGLTFSNEVISRDEGLHAMLSFILYTRLRNRLPQSRIHAIFLSVYECEANFVKEALKCDLVGMNERMMVEHVKFMVNWWLVGQLHIEPLFPNVKKSPFEWMTISGINGKTNQFEKRVGEYNSKATTKEVSYVFNKHAPF